MDTVLRAYRRTILLMAIFTERWVLSIVFLHLAWTELIKARGIYSGHRAMETTVFVDVGHHLILFILACLTGSFLIVARQAEVWPERLRFIFVPLATTFFTLFYYTVPSFPPGWQVSLCPR